eukprot:1754988-Rhodomonas_salina.1
MSRQGLLTPSTCLKATPPSQIQDLVFLVQTESTQPHLAFNFAGMMPRGSTQPQLHCKSGHEWRICFHDCTRGPTGPWTGSVELEPDARSSLARLLAAKQPMLLRAGHCIAGYTMSVPDMAQRGSGMGCVGAAQIKAGHSTACALSVPGIA